MAKVRTAEKRCRNSLSVLDADAPSGSWVVGTTSDNDFAFTFQGEAKLVVQNEGEVHDTAYFTVDHFCVWGRYGALR